MLLWRNCAKIVVHNLHPTNSIDKQRIHLDQGESPEILEVIAERLNYCIVSRGSSISAGMRKQWLLF